MPRGPQHERRAVGTPARAAERGAQRIEILPLWAPCAPAVSPLGGGAPGTNTALTPNLGARATRRVTPCPTTPAGRSATGGGAPAAVGAAAGVAAGPGAATGEE